MKARIALLVLGFVCACNRPHSADAQLADLPHKTIQPFLDGFELTFGPNGDTCGELDLAKTRATLNGKPMSFSDNGGAELTIKGRWLGSCNEIFLNTDSAPPPGRVVLQLQDASETLTETWDAFGDTRTLTPEFDGGVRPGQVLGFALTPASDTLLPAVDAGFDSTQAELLWPDGGSEPVALGFGEHELQVTIPAGTAPGSATLDLHAVVTRNQPTGCDGFQLCVPDGHAFDAQFTLNVVP